MCSAFIVFRQNVVLSHIRALYCNHLSVILTPKRTCYCNFNKSRLKTCASTQCSVCSGFWTVVQTNGSTNAFLVINGINFMITATDDMKIKKKIVIQATEWNRTSYKIQLNSKQSTKNRNRNSN